MTSDRLSLSSLFSYLQRFEQITPEMQEYIPAITTTQQYSAKSFLLKAGQVCHQAWYLQKGYVRWFREIKGKEETLWISRPDSAILIPRCFFLQMTSNYSLQAMGDCETVYSTYNEMLVMYDRFPNTRSMVTKIVDFHTSEIFQYAQEMRLAKAEDRLRYLYKVIGSDIYSLDPAVLSSFINVTESTFFKIRKKMEE